MARFSPSSAPPPTRHPVRPALPGTAPPAPWAATCRLWRGFFRATIRGSNLTLRIMPPAHRTSSGRDRPVSDARHWSRHWGGFILSGGTAAVVDAILTLALIHWVDLNAFL